MFSDRTMTMSRGGGICVSDTTLAMSGVEVIVSGSTMVVLKGTTMVVLKGTTMVVLKGTIMFIKD